MEQGPLLSNVVQQQSRKPEASLITANIAFAYLLIINLLSFEIINLVVETAALIIVGVFFLALLESSSALRVLFLKSDRLCYFISYYKQMILSLLLWFSSYEGAVVKQAQNIVVTIKSLNVAPYSGISMQ